MNRPQILVVDDDPLVLDSLGMMLSADGYAVQRASSAEEGLAELEASTPNLVLLDVNLPGMSGTEFLARASRRRPGLPVLVITAYGSIESAVKAMKLGARDYIAKPLDDFDLLAKVRRALSERDLADENRSLRSELDRLRSPEEIVGRHPSMNRVFAIVEAVATTRATVLIQGESGTGKSMLARAIHKNSDRALRPFVEVSCGSLPDPLLESELFGFERGAFTGADRSRAGKIEAAEEGTLFLDEIGNATPALQVKLLRVLQDRVFERLGSNDPRWVDVRVILATNANLEKQVAEGAFREDLYYRINVVSITMPPLRERSSDLPALVEHFVGRFGAEHEKSVEGVEPDVLALLSCCPWPGNVRELENAIEHAVVLSQGTRIRCQDLPAKYRAASSPVDNPLLPLKKAMETPERQYIQRVLKMNAGNRQKTADMLKVNRTTLFNKMKKYDLFEPGE